MSVILFISAHQDDETLSMGAAIINHVAAGHRVYSGCVTDGSGSGVRGTNGIPSDTKSFINARNTEMINSLRELGASFIEGSTARLKDGTLSTNVSSTFPGDDGNDLRTVNPLVLARVRDLLKQVSINSGVAIKDINVKTHSHHDAHPDHRAVCQAVLYLLNVTKEINEVRHYVSPGQWTDTQVYKGKEYQNASQLSAYMELNAANAQRINTASLNYVKQGTTPAWGGSGTSTYGIGYFSVETLFNTVNQKRCSYYHVPPVCTLP